MKPMGLIGLIGPIGLIGLIGLMGCSEELEGSEEQVGDKARVTMEVVPCATMFTEEQEPEVTRAWIPPSPYVTYDNINSQFAQQEDLINKSINVFFTQDGQTPMEGTFFYRNTDRTWNLNAELENKTYYLYGYIPKEDATGFSIVSYDGSNPAGNDNAKYSEGAKLTINGLNTITPSDVCVIIGAKNGATDYKENTDFSVTGLQPGKFDVAAKATNSSGATGNYIFLLFDHLYSALRFGFKVHEDYAALRTIKLRKLELTNYGDEYDAPVRAKYNATITLRKNDTGTSPIVGSVVFTPDETSAFVSQVPIFDGEVELSTSNPVNFMGCFVPSGNTYFKLRSTYDVYDKQGNLIREGCQAENTIDLSEWFSPIRETERGHSYSLTIMVQPTYLYVMSDPDLLDELMVKIVN